MFKVFIKVVPAVLAALVLAGCSGSGTKGDLQPPADVEDRGAAGADTAGASGAWSDAASKYAGDPLNDPASLLSKRTIYFAFDSAEVAPEYRDVVAAHAEYLAAHPTTTVTLEGHADERGSREYNIGLGERRAKTVQDLLSAQGVGGSQTQTISYGEERPLNMAHDESAWSQNRRVELVY